MENLEITISLYSKPVLLFLCWSSIGETAFNSLVLEGKIMEPVQPGRCREYGARTSESGQQDEKHENDKNTDRPSTRLGVPVTSCIMIICHNAIAIKPSFFVHDPSAPVLRHAIWALGSLMKF